MKKSIKIAGGTMTLILIIASINFLGKLVSPVDTDVGFRTINTFHSLPEDSVEVIVYGSSIAWRGVDVMEMYENYGIAAYNYGCNWQMINTSLLFFQDSLKAQSPKVIAVETTYVYGILEDANVGGEIHYTKAIGESPEKHRYLKQCFGNDIERWVSYYMPLCAFHDNWVNLSEESFTYFDKNAISPDLYRTMGFMRIDSVEPVEIGNWRNFPQYDLSEKSLSVLDEFVRTCKENHIDIIFYKAPAARDYYYFDAMKSYAAENGCTYINFYEIAEEIGIDEKTDFSDKTHLNASGATKLADYLAKFIVANYEITDMRQYDGNPWQIALDMK